MITQWRRRRNQYSLSMTISWYPIIFEDTIYDLYDETKKLDGLRKCVLLDTWWNHGNLDEEYHCVWFVEMRFSTIISLRPTDDRFIVQRMISWRIGIKYCRLCGRLSIFWIEDTCDSRWHTPFVGVSHYQFNSMVSAGIVGIQQSNPIRRWYRRSIGIRDKCDIDKGASWSSVRIKNISNRTYQRPAETLYKRWNLKTASYLYE